MAGDIERELAHAKAMATADHKPDCRPGRGQVCESCVTAADRVLWAQLAAEYQAQLDRHRQETLL